MFDNDITIEDINFDLSMPVDLAVVTSKETKRSRLYPTKGHQGLSVRARKSQRPTEPPFSYDLRPEREVTLDEDTSYKIMPNKHLKLGIIPFSIPAHFDASTAVVSSTKSPQTGHSTSYSKEHTPSQVDIGVVVAEIIKFGPSTFRQGELTKRLRNKMSAAEIKKILAYLVELDGYLEEVEIQKMSSPKGGRRPSKTYKVSKCKQCDGG